MAINFPSNPTNGQQYINPTSGVIYTYSNTSTTWEVSANSLIAAGYTGSIGATGAGVVGGGSNRGFIENDNTITDNYTISTNKNAMSAGPITINSGVEVTVPANSVWTIV